MSNSSSPAPGTTSSVQEQLPLVIGCAVGYSLAVLSTLFRLLYQFRRRQLWWDDFWAGCAFLCTLVSVTISLKSVLPPPGDYPDSVLSFFAWGTFMMQAAVIWFSRMSILATIIRILPNPSRGRFITKASFAVFFVFWIATTVSKVFYNGTAVKLIPDRPWSLVPTIVVLILNTVATVWLVTWPAYLILRMTSLARPLRRLLTICFGTAIILLAVDIWQAANLFIEAFGLALISAHLELILSLLLANVIILATYIYRIFHNGDGSSGGSDSDTTTKQPRRGSQGRLPLPLSQQSS
ncbi:hypothetical protein CC1G_09290 [Coprinopsis cinerea okayama7|uniref:Integral membrane protein n=1 Tax=Coprinopsis cinerea (strain Okayama-7 / 130 / ATCC MYA-4618 / FGSC 9003) TaxID=240176 RepID=A8N869_COPC7|nr:hypothetical protein CC1G_09290 [Coprinopsis cinerea okayama7\|eukprot:XP_001831025.2 hypothetical protein CC1G_09290 [Coprinopsis cinerea okayama7\